MVVTDAKPAGKGKITLVVTYNGQRDFKLEEAIRDYSRYLRRDESSEFVTVHACEMPQRPPEGTKLIVLNCDPSPDFRGVENYKEIPTYSAIWGNGGTISYFRVRDMTDLKATEAQMRVF